MSLSKQELQQVVAYLQEHKFIGGPLIDEPDGIVAVHVPTAESVGVDMDELDELLASNRNEQPAYKYLFKLGLPHRESKKLIEQRLEGR